MAQADSVHTPNCDAATGRMLPATRLSTFRSRMTSALESPSLAITSLAMRGRAICTLPRSRRQRRVQKERLMALMDGGARDSVRQTN